MTKTMICQHCGKEFEAQRKTRRFCSSACANRSAWRVQKKRTCLQCGNEFILASAADANRKYCSQACSKKAYSKHLQSWSFEHPDAQKEYNKTRLIKNPGAWREKHHNERLEAIKLLGGVCVVCGVENTNWLHIDYIPTTRGKPYRHPRHLKFIREHLSDFRLLCANHHYELTLTGKIEGTEIIQ